MEVVKRPHIDSELVSELKLVAPKSFEHFRTVYLPKYFKYWEVSPDKNTIWFCEMQEYAQVGYLMHYIHDVRKEPLHDLVWLTQLSVDKARRIQNYIILKFTELESNA